MRIAALGLLALVVACAPAAAPSAPPLVFDCAAGFETLSARIAARPEMKAAPVISGEPYRTFNAADSQASYIVTEAGAPGHPAIVRQAAGPSGKVTDGCPYGDPKGFQALVTYVEGLAAVTGGKP